MSSLVLDYFLWKCNFKAEIVICNYLIGILKYYHVKVGVSDGSDGPRGANGNGFFDYTQNRFVMPDGR